MQSFSWSVRFSRTSKNFPDSGFPPPITSGKGVVADIGAQIWKFTSSFLFATFVDISTQLDLDIYRRTLFLQQIANF